MHTYDIGAFLSGHVFVFVMLLARIGSVILLFPGIGESYVPPRTRMIFACLICFLLLGPMLGRFPPLPASSAELTRLLVIEIVIGLFFGTLVRMTLGILEAAGMIIGIQSGLSSATMMNPALATQSPLPSAFLSIVGLVLIFISGLDHYLLRTAVSLYDLFPPGGEMMIGDIASTVMHVANRSFVLGIELAAPFLICGLLLFASLGVLQRLMPSIQLFLVILPLEIWGGLMVLSLSFAGILTLWLQYFDKSISTFFQG
ncbi:MAG: flagellar biosynthetic protein FliR [Alphaproteobacteria bacterium]|nr:flagellar biosynthetic protein FliR [Alphaproteobacteria bacterium]